MVCLALINTPGISYLDFSADDPKRAVDFYTKVFGWQINKWDGPREYWEIKTGDSNELGIDGGLSKREKIGQLDNSFHKSFIDRSIYCQSSPVVEKLLNLQP